MFTFAVNQAKSIPCSVHLFEFNEHERLASPPYWPDRINTAIILLLDSLAVHPHRPRHASNEWRRS